MQPLTAGGVTEGKEDSPADGPTITAEKTFSQKMRETEIFRAKAAATRTQRASEQMLNAAAGYENCSAVSTFHPESDIETD